jgi:hypothetical protein
MTDYSKLDAYPALNLIKGSGLTYEQGFCVMQAVAWFAGEAHTDAPECACPGLTAFAIRLNDLLADDKRQTLRRLIAPLTGTRSAAHRGLRSDYMLRRVVHELVAPLFDTKWPEHAKAMRAAQTRDALRAACSLAAADADAAAYAAAYAANADAAYAAYAAYVAAYAAVAADAADAAAAAADAAYGAERRRAQGVMIDILDGAIRLGPNGGDDLAPFAERVHEMSQRGFLETVS